MYANGEDAEAAKLLALKHIKAYACAQDIYLSLWYIFT